MKNTVAAFVPDFLMKSPEGSNPSDVVFPAFSEMALYIRKQLAMLIPEYLGGFPAGPTPSGFLKVTDSRTGSNYDIPIHHNSVEATQFKQIKTRRDSQHVTDKVEGGLRLLDPGYQNTAVTSSEVTFV